MMTMNTYENDGCFILGCVLGSACAAVNCIVIQVSLLAWTTTPWTLPSNLALCVNKEFEYIKLR